MEITTGTDVNDVRIHSLHHIQGQSNVVDTLQLHLRAYFNIRSTSKVSDLAFGPVIFTGPSGTGKTLAAGALHAELGNLKLIETNGGTINKKSELFSILLDADANTTVFIDEAQGMNSKTQQILLTAISEKKLPVSTNTSSGSFYSVPLANFTVILATTHEYHLLDALRNRMRIYCRFNYYSVKDLTEIVRQRASALKWGYESDHVLETIAQRAKNTPRLALNTNLQTCWHVAINHNRDIITLDDTHEAFKYLQIDEAGLDKLDRSYLSILKEHEQLALGVLSSKLSLPPLTLTKVVEPYLLREGFIAKDKTSARVITPKGKEYIIKTSSTSKVVNDNAIK